MQTTHKGRTFQLTQGAEMANLRAHLVSKGFDGNVYFGVAAPIGKQRKEFNGMFYRSAKTGEFCKVI